MVRLIGEIGKAAGLEIVAEYVESASIVTLLEKYGIDYAQGYYVGRPVPRPASAIMHIDGYRKVTRDIEAEPVPAMDELGFRVRL
jgi:EAL domain-containing protein (putative c-di-GMP-specific phosphodiesterase class I)